jgi:membrane protein required for colicin V production
MGMAHMPGRAVPRRSSHGNESRRSVNALDIIVIAIVALSALFAFARGFVKESLSIAAWVGAGLITLYGLPHLRPIALKYISTPLLADAAAGVTLFVVSLIVLSLLTSAIAGRVKQSALSAVDRALGLLFGAFRGVVIACLGFLALSWAIPKEGDWPSWVRGARTRTFLASGAEVLKSLVPSEARERGAATALEAQRSFEQAREAEQMTRALLNPAAPAPGKTGPSAGYKPAERREMDRLMQSLPQ